MTPTIATLAPEAPAVEVALASEPEDRPPAGAPPVAGDLEAVCALWPAVVDLVRGENALIAAVIGEARPVGVDGDDLTLAFASTAQFLKKKAEDPANRMIVGEALRAVSGKRWRLSYELREELADHQRPGDAERSEEDWIRRFMDEFDAEEITGESGAQGGDPPVQDGDPPVQDGDLPVQDGDLPVQDGEPEVEAVTSNEKGA